MKFYKLFFTAICCSSLAVGSSLASDETLSGHELLKRGEESMQNPDVSPIRRIDRDLSKPKSKSQQVTEYRTIDGSNNNLEHPDINKSHTPLLRLTPADYSDGVSALAGPNRRSARVISNIVIDQEGDVFTPVRASDYLWQWGQFIDHDLDLTEGAFPAEPANIPVPTGDEFFDPSGTGTASIELNRSIFEEGTGTSNSHPREQLNEINGWIDASNVYGNDDERAEFLRTLDGTGKLKTSEGNLLPFNNGEIPNGGGEDPALGLFVAGDLRANEQLALTAMHTLFMREHNRLAEIIGHRYPHLSGDEIYQRVRKIVGAQMQVITYNEFLPVLLGEKALKKYSGYNSSIDASISTEFSTAAFRLGHSLLSPQILRVDHRGKTIAEGNLALRDAFFTPGTLAAEGGIGPILRGLAAQPCQDLDSLVIDDVRNFLFGLPGQGGFDLAALNIQRGRDHGLSSYNDTRRYLGLRPIKRFKQITNDAEVIARLEAAYDSVEDIDLWVGGLAERNFRDALVGKTFFRILKDQFERTRDGDRFWYQRTFYGKALESIEATTLAKVIRRNTEGSSRIQDNVFLVNGSTYH